jgi:hypothetical protein
MVIISAVWPPEPRTTRARTEESHMPELKCFGTNAILNSQITQHAATQDGANSKEDRTVNHVMASKQQTQVHSRSMRL